MKRRRTLLVTLALSAALVAAVVALRRPYAWFLARHWRNRLETVPEERAGVLLEGIARLGDPGIPVLVEAIGSERACVAGGARRVLAKEMGRWESLRARDYSPKLAVLAEALADHVDQLNPAARADAADLAAEILSLWTLDATVVDPAEVIACCEKVLRTPNPQRPLLAQRRSRDQPAERGSSGEPLSGASAGLQAGEDEAGGRFHSADQATLDTVELMRRLQAADSQTVAGARAELVRRGFTEVHLALARQLFDPDPEVRARLGRVLLGLPDVDPVPWLVELSHDQDPEVRLAVIALMATTGDEALLKAVEKSAREDPDPRVQQQAERIARKRRTAGY